MSRNLIVLNSKADRERVARYASAAPTGTRVEFKASKRTLPQNDLFWSLLTDVARQLPWHGTKLTPDNWKLLFLDALKGELKVIPNINGDGVVSIGRSSSDLTKEEMSSIIELIREFGSRHGISFIDDRT